MKIIILFLSMLFSLSLAAQDVNVSGIYPVHIINETGYSNDSICSQRGHIFNLSKIKRPAKDPLKKIIFIDEKDSTVMIDKTKVGSVSVYCVRCKTYIRKEIGEEKRITTWNK